MLDVPDDVILREDFEKLIFAFRRLNLGRIYSAT